MYVEDTALMDATSSHICFTVNLFVPLRDSKSIQGVGNFWEVQTFWRAQVALLCHGTIIWKSMAKFGEEVLRYGMWVGGKLLPFSFLNLSKFETCLQIILPKLSYLFVSPILVKCGATKKVLGHCKLPSPVYSYYFILVTVAVIFICKWNN